MTAMETITPKMFPCIKMVRMAVFTNMAMKILIEVEVASFVREVYLSNLPSFLRTIFKIVLTITITKAPKIENMTLNTLLM